MAKAAELAFSEARRRLLLSLDDSYDSLAVEDDGMQKPVVEEDSPTQPQPRLRPPPLTAAALLLPLSTVIPKFDCPPELEDSPLGTQQLHDEVWTREKLRPPIKCFLCNEEGVQGLTVSARDNEGRHESYTYDREEALFIRQNSLFPPLQIQCWHPQSSAWKFWDGDADGLPKLLPDEKVPLRAVDRFGKWRIFAWASSSDCLKRYDEVEEAERKKEYPSPELLWGSSIIER